jgi:hypothetical protein
LYEREGGSGEREKILETRGSINNEGPNNRAEFEEENEVWNAGDADSGGLPEDDIGGVPCYEGDLVRVETNQSPMEGVEETGETSGKGELEKQDGWPIWLRSAVTMLHEGERGYQLESILVKLTRMEKALGFKREKTVMIIYIHNG